jgi:DNA-directed RNA polymerase specialized sigma24 family protein
MVKDAFEIELSAAAAKAATRLRRMGLMRHDEEDVVQEALVRFLARRTAAGINGPALSAYIGTSAENLAKNAWRSTQVRSESDLRTTSAAVHSDLDGMLDARTHLSSLRALPVTLQELACLIALGHSLSECAERLALPLGTVKSRLRRLRTLHADAAKPTSRKNGQNEP